MTVEFGRLPGKNEMELYRRTDPAFPTTNTLRRHFGNREDLTAALRRHCSSTPELSEVLGLLPVSAPPTRASTSPKTVDGWVYLIGSGGHFKIGKSDDLERRVKEIRIALPEAATMVHSIRTDDPSGIEAYWHRRFADRRANGEWFKLTPADVSAFKRRKFQ